MRVCVLTGEDEWALRAHRAALLTELGVTASGVERFDLTEDGGTALAQDAAAMSLFAGPRVLDADPAEALSEQAAAALVNADSDAVVIIRGARPLAAAARKKLADTAEFHAFRVPTGWGITDRINELAAANSVTLTAASRQVLVERGGHDLPRVAGVLTQLASIGLLSPTEAELHRMLGSSAAPGVPWALSDAIEGGDVATALELAATLEPAAVVAYLANRTGQLGRILDDDLRDPDAIAGAFGMAHAFPAQKLARLAGLVGKAGVAASWDAISAADRSVKVAPDPRAALDVLLVRLAQLWSVPASAAAHSHR